MRVLELFCGIGGCAAALGASRVVAAVDINLVALGCYQGNFPHRTLRRSVESLRGPEIESLGAELWWLSPPCQPYTRRGKRLDHEDPRSAGLLATLRHLRALRPPWVALENVPEFATSRSCRLVLEALEDAEYSVETLELCPTSLGIPNRRRRFYLLAGRRQRPRPRPRPRVTPTPLAEFLDPDPAPELAVDPVRLRRYRRAMDLVRPEEASAVAATFTSAYGRSPVRSGSYLETSDGARHFSPAEILRLLGFPVSYRLPPELPLASAWRLVGNSLSVCAVRHLLSAIPGLEVVAEAPRPEGEACLPTTDRALTAPASPRLGERRPGTLSPPSGPRTPGLSPRRA